MFGLLVKIMKITPNHGIYFFLFRPLLGRKSENIPAHGTARPGTRPGTAFPASALTTRFDGFTAFINVHPKALEKRADLNLMSQWINAYHRQSLTSTSRIFIFSQLSLTDEIYAGDPRYKMHESCFRLYADNSSAYFRLYYPPTLENSYKRFPK